LYYLCLLCWHNWSLLFYFLTYVFITCVRDNLLLYFLMGLRLVILCRMSFRLFISLRASAITTERQKWLAVSEWLVVISSIPIYLLDSRIDWSRSFINWKMYCIAKSCIWFSIDQCISFIFIDNRKEYIMNNLSNFCIRNKLWNICYFKFYSNGDQSLCLNEEDGDNVLYSEIIRQDNIFHVYT
jgi:hypothetical protein